jgi:hypothetical protein
VSFLITVTHALYKQLREGRIYFDSWFQTSQSTVFGSIDSGPRVRQNSIAEGACGGEGWSPHSRQEEDSRERTGVKVMLPVTYFLQLDPISQSFHYHPK